MSQAIRAQQCPNGLWVHQVAGRRAPLEVAEPNQAALFARQKVRSLE